MKSALAETFGPVEAEEEFPLALFSLCQTDSMSLEEYVLEFTRLSLGNPDLDERSRALLFTRGLSNHLNSEVMREHPRTLSDTIRSARVARRTCSCSTLVEDQTEWPREQREFQPEERWLVCQLNPTRYNRSSDLQLGLCVRN